MKDIVRGNDIIIKDTGSHKSLVNFTLSQAQLLSQLTYTIGYEFKDFIIHFKSSS